MMSQLTPITSRTVTNFYNLVGMKRELENAYKQIDMYKRTIENLKGK